MATKLYLHDSTNSLIGSFPTGEQSSVFPGATATDANTLRTLNTTIGAAQASLTCATSATTTNQSDFMGFFCSPFLDGAQTVGGGDIVFNMGSFVNNSALNGWINAINIYIWNPTGNSKRGTILDSAQTSLGSSKKNANTEYCIYITGIATSSVSAQDGDVIICEIWSNFTQGMSVSYTLRLDYDGATETNSDGTSVSDHASYIQLNENLTFKSGETTTTTSTSTSTSTSTTSTSTSTSTTSTSTSTSTTSTSTSTTSTSTSTSTTSTSTSTTSTSTTTNALVNRFFAYNTGTTVPNTDIVGDLIISTSTTDIIGSSSQVKWWAGPSEQIGYVIAYAVPARNHPTQWGNIAEVGFKRSDNLTDQSLLDRINYMRGDLGLSEFGILADGLTWLDSINNWYSHGK